MKPVREEGVEGDIIFLPVGPYCGAAKLFDVL